jgi:hypothetical protein
MAKALIQPNLKRALQFEVHRSAGWATLLTGPIESRELLDPHPGPGLWKRLSGHVTESVRLGFDLPLSAVESQPEDGPGDGADDQMAECLEWGEASLRGDVPPGWELPERAEVESWIGKGRLTVHAGTFVRQGSLILADGRMALQLPIVAADLRRLSAPRRRRLVSLLEDAQARWRLVRLRADLGADLVMVVAEVDLTGAPAGILPEMVACGLDGLHWVASWLMVSAGLLADASVSCRSWDLDLAGLAPAQTTEE